MNNKVKRITNLDKYLLGGAILIIMFILIFFIFRSDNVSAKDMVSDETQASSENIAQINQKLKKNVSNELKSGNKFLIDKKNKNIQKIIISGISNKSKQDADLQKGVITFKNYDNLNGNYVLFGHNSYYGNYLTPEVKNLNVDDELEIWEKQDNKTIKYLYQVESRSIVQNDEVDKVYYQSDEPILTLGTCETWQKTNKRIIWTSTLKNKKEVNDKEILEIRNW